MDESPKHDKWKKSVKRPHIVWLLLCEICRKGKSIDTESRLLLPRVRVRARAGIWMEIG